MKVNKSSSKHHTYFILGLILLWIVLFEFILPFNRIFPSPSVVAMSLEALWNVYKLPVNFLITVSVVYFSIISAYFFIYILRNYLVKHNHLISEFVFSLSLFAKYIPGIIFGLFLLFWFPLSPYIEFVFAFGTAFFSILIKLRREVSSCNREYIDSAKSLGADDSTVRKKVVWNSVQPALFEHLFDLHLYIWLVLIIFEYIKGQYGLGNIFRTALRYGDLSALFSMTVIIAAVVYLGTFLIRYVKNKFFNWGIS